VKIGKWVVGGRWWVVGENIDRFNHLLIEITGMKGGAFQVFYFNKHFSLLIKNKYTS
jgi:hypothetical protein